MEIEESTEKIGTFAKKKSLLLLLALFVLIDVFSYSLIYFQNQKKYSECLSREKVFVQKDSSLTTGDSCCKLGKEFGKEIAGCQNDKFVVRDSLQNCETENIPKISDIKGPRIDSQAASVELSVTFKAPEKPIVSEVTEKIVPNLTLPIKIWIFLFFAYIALLIFNLAYNFNYVVKPQWFWELALTFLAVGAWYILDSQKINIWYPIFVLKTGILIYVVYLCFLNKKQKQLPLF